MLQELQSIKLQLNDAPSEVKSSFNSIINYFSSNGLPSTKLGKLSTLETKISNLKKQIESTSDTKEIKRLNLQLSILEVERDAVLKVINLSKELNSL